MMIWCVPPTAVVAYSELNGVYLDYERELYVEMLNDWQWTASTEPPPWYTGQP